MLNRRKLKPPKPKHRHLLDQKEVIEVNYQPEAEELQEEQAEEEADEKIEMKYVH